MSAKKHRASHNGRKIAIYKWTHPTTGAIRWRWQWRDADNKRHTRTHGTLAEAERAALRYLQRTDADPLAAIPLDRQRFLAEVERLVPAGDERAILDYLRGRGKTAEIVGAVARYAAHKETEAGEITPHLRQQRAILDGMALAFAGRSVADVHAPELAEWWQARCAGHSPKRAKDIRGALCSFWRWCRREGIAGADPITPAERLPTPHVGEQERRVLTPAELRRILREVAREWRAWVVLGAFAGLRPEEIAPPAGKAKRSEKRGLRCEEIDWEFSVIRLPAAVSKVRKPRIIPMSDALKSALIWAGIEPGMQGRVCLRSPQKAGELERIGAIIGGGWPRNALRHSYGSYRNALVRSLPQVAEEMGTSVSMLHSHYHNPRAKAEGEAWFALRPPFLEGGAKKISARQP